MGRPAKPVRLTRGLPILKHMCDLSDKPVVEQWSENAGCQYFFGMEEFTPPFPRNATEPVRFHKRVGEKGLKLILPESIRVNQNNDDGNRHDTAFIDSTVREKNATFPTDAKSHKKTVRQAFFLSNVPMKETKSYVFSISAKTI